MNFDEQNWPQFREEAIAILQTDYRGNRPIIREYELPSDKRLYICEGSFLDPLFILARDYRNRESAIKHSPHNPGYEYPFVGTADLGRQPIGFFALNETQTLDMKRVASSVYTYISPHYRGRGIGAVLFFDSRIVMINNPDAEAVIFDVNNPRIITLLRRMGIRRRAKPDERSQIDYELDLRDGGRDFYTALFTEELAKYARLVKK